MTEGKGRNQNVYLKIKHKAILGKHKYENKPKFSPKCVKSLYSAKGHKS